MKYIHQRTDWPNFTWNAEAILPVLAAVRHKQGLLLGRMQSLGFDLQQEATLQSLTQNALTTSEIEGEHLPQPEVRSSVARRMGLDQAGVDVKDRRVEGVVELMLDATRNYSGPITQERLFGWQSLLFPTGYSGSVKIDVGQWRAPGSASMQVVSGALGKEKVHFEAPAAELLPKEMDQFLAWLNTNQLDLVLKSGVAHLWFLTVHPFDDGNGRIARALSDLLLARAEATPMRFYSFSAAIQSRKKQYYLNLERAQKGELDITDWLLWYLETLDLALNQAETLLQQTLRKAAFWQQNKDLPLNARQLELLNRLLDGFEGTLSSGKAARITNTSQDTAFRDLTQLVTWSILKPTGAGRGRGYGLA